ncbi:unnamed protein product, partial [Owenia fusiformis]
DNYIPERIGCVMDSAEIEYNYPINIPFIHHFINEELTVNMTGSELDSVEPVINHEKLPVTMTSARWQNAIKSEGIIQTDVKRLADAVRSNGPLHFSEADQLSFEMGDWDFFGINITDVIIYVSFALAVIAIISNIYVLTKIKFILTTILSIKSVMKAEGRQFIVKSMRDTTTSRTPENMKYLNVTQTWSIIILTIMTFYVLVM